MFSTPPFEADGFVWYRGIVVSATGELPPLPQPLFGAGERTAGWFAATKGSTAYVARVEPRCPSRVDLRYVVAMLPAERLACFDDRSIELEGTFGCPGCSVELAGMWDPVWLAYPRADLIWEVPMEGEPLRIKFPPNGPDAPADGSIIKVRGHFRDDAATRCAISTIYPWVDDADAVHDVPDIVSRQLCRQEFVVESYDVIGTDPDFESG